MLSILAVVLGLVIIVTAISADRSARARHNFRAIVLNLCGIGCLAFGLFSVYHWSHHGIDRSHQVAVVSHNGTVVSHGDHRATMVQLVISSDGRLAQPAERQSEVGLAEEETFAEAESEIATVNINVDGVKVEGASQLSPEALEATLEEIELEDLAAAADTTSADTVTDSGLAPEMRTQVEIDFAARPEWVEQPDRDVGQVHQISIASGPYVGQRIARTELYKELKAATDEYINDVVGNSNAAHWVGYDEQQIRQRFVASDHIFDEKIISPSVGVMHQSHALLEFGPAFHSDVAEAWHQVMARAQLVKVALGGGAVLGMLILMFGYFKADTATRGFYSGRLKFVTVVAILAVIATGLLVARSIPWLWL